MSALDAFMDRVDTTGDCWIWTGATQTHGYGSVWDPARGRAILAHRRSWELTIGDIPAGLSVCHLCDNPTCVRPSHLVLGAHRANMADMAMKGRSDRGTSRWSAKLTDAQVAEIRDMYAAGHHTQRALAEAFDVSQSTVSLLVRDRTWRHVRGAA